MGRTPKKGKLTKERENLATLISISFNKGDRGAGKPGSKGLPWTDPELGRAAHASPKQIVAWRNLQTPTLPNQIKGLLDAFFGQREDLKKERAAMQRAWVQAGGNASNLPMENLPKPDKNFSDFAMVVALDVNTPEWTNSGILKVPFTLKMLREEELNCEIEVRGKKVTVSIGLALAGALFSVASLYWRPLPETVFREKTHRNIDGTKGGADMVAIVGPRDGDGPIMGKPLEDEPYVLMEHSQEEIGNGPITLAVHVPRKDGFQVTLGDEPAIVARQSGW